MLAVAVCFAGLVGCGVTSGTNKSSDLSNASGTPVASASSIPGGQDPGQMGDPTQHILSDMTSKLGLTAEQQTQVQTILQDTFSQIQALHDANQDAAQAAFQAMQTAQQSGDQTAITAAQSQIDSVMAQDKAIMDAADQKIRALLTTEQQATFDQMLADRPQMTGPGGPGGPGGLGGPGGPSLPFDQLNLTADQQTQIQQIMDTARSQSTPGTPPDQATMESVRQQINAVLTADQKAQLEALRAQAPAMP